MGRLGRMTHGPDTVESGFHAGARLLATGDARAAAERLRAVVSVDGLAPGFEAEARYLLGARWASPATATA